MTLIKDMFWSTHTSPSVGKGVCVYSSPSLLSTSGTFFMGHTKNTELRGGEGREREEVRMWKHEQKYMYMYLIDEIYSRYKTEHVLYMMKRLRNIFRELRKTGSHPGLN